MDSDKIWGKMTSIFETNSHHYNMTPVNKTMPACTSASGDASTKIHDLNSDILTQIFEEVTIQNRDEIAIFKTKYDKFIQDKGYGDIDFTNAQVCVDDKEDEVHDWICDYMNNLSQNQINVILCDYGINKALKQIYDFHTIGMGDSDADFCEELLINPSDRQMVELIFKGEAKFMSGWKIPN
jgi:hypothetical protein